MDELLVSYDTFSIYHIYDYRCDKNYYNRIIIRHDERYHVTLFFDETVLENTDVVPDNYNPGSSINQYFNVSLDGDLENIVDNISDNVITYLNKYYQERYGLDHDVFFEDRPEPVLTLTYYKKYGDHVELEEIPFYTITPNFREIINDIRLLITPEIDIIYHDNSYRERIELLLR